MDPTRLQLKRKSVGFTQKRLADESGVSIRMIQHYEQRAKNINTAEAYTVYRMAKALDCTVEDILELDDPK